MPTIDTRPPCRAPGCRGRAVRGGFCEDHQSDVRRRHKNYNAFGRNKAKGRVYGSRRWRRLSRYVLERWPLCVRCKANGRLTPAALVDHLAGFVDDSDPRAWDIDDLYPLCVRCHAVVTAMEKKIDFRSMPRPDAVRLKYSGAEMKEAPEPAL